MKTSLKNKSKRPYKHNKEAKLNAEAQPLKDIYQRITDKILCDLEKGNLTWRKPWNASHLQGQVKRPLRWNNIPYSGINTFLLWGEASERGFTSPYWMTFKQALELKAAVRKGEKGTQIVYADKIIIEEDDDKGGTNTIQIPFLKSYIVFNASQIEGLPEKYNEIILPQTVINQQERIEEIETFFAKTKADIYTGIHATYNQSTDRIQMPPFESFETPESYYAILAHELTHWTKHPKRLDRDFGRKRFGDEGYAKEELVAELGACFLAADLSIEPMPEEKHSAYIEGWMQALKEDKHFIFSAASYAQKAVTFIHNLQNC